jgi:FkbM family methyltransferase
MNFISYAQNGEDVLLWRALKHVKKGFYIDVGANDPIIDSVTKAFYEHGWSGINIEPLPEFYHRFHTERPRDINLSIAAGAEEGRATLFDVPARRGWASLNKSLVALCQGEGLEIDELIVPVKTLVDICQQHVSGEIHFLKIDVEGFEAEVLRGMNFSLWRPWIVVVEAVRPNTQIANHQQWEHLIASHDYHFAYYDGINRFYVASEHASLLDALQVQANILDGYVPVTVVKTWEAEEKCRVAELQLRELQASVAKVLMEREQSLIKANAADDLESPGPDYAHEPCCRRAASSVSALCAGAPVYRYAMDLGVAKLIRAVEENGSLSRRLLALSISASQPDIPVPDIPFERQLVHLIEDVRDLAWEELSIFGAGEYGRFFARIAGLAGVRVTSYLDNNAAGLGSIDGVEVVEPGDACEAPGPPIVIASRHHCGVMVNQVTALLRGRERVLFTHFNSWRSRLAGNSPLRSADAACRDLLREYIESEAALAAVFLLCNYRRFVHQWSEGDLPRAILARVAAPSPFVCKR